jgi:SAM-dependent methyltransferase
MAESKMICAKPVDIATRETVAFLTSHLPSGAEMLEVGCGEGAVAAELSRRAYRVIGIDSDAEAVARTQRHGVRAVVASWPEFAGAPVDAIAFTRSLHHIHPLHGAVGRARELIKPLGSLLVEDFDFAAASDATIQWFFGALHSQAAGVLIHRTAGTFVDDLLRSEGPSALWHRRHDHDLHSIAEMRQAIAAHFIVGEVEATPYLYRYLVPVLAETAEAAAFIDQVFQEEMRLGKQDEIVLIGRRLMGSVAEVEMA